MIFPKIDMTYNGIKYDYYYECGGGYGDIITHLCIAGIFYFIDHFLDSNMLIVLWAPNKEIEKLFERYDKQITIVTYTFQNYSTYKLFLDNRKNIQLPTIDSIQYKKAREVFNVNSSEYSYNRKLWIKGSVDKWNTVANCNYLLSDREMFDIRITEDEQLFYDKIKNDKYVVIHYTSGTSPRYIPFSVTVNLIKLLLKSYKIIILGSNGALRDKQGFYDFDDDIKLHKNYYDLIDNSSIQFSMFLVKNAHLLITSYSSMFCIAGLFNVNTLCFIPYDLLLDIQTKTSYSYVTYYFFSKNCHLVEYQANYMENNLGNAQCKLVKMGDKLRCRYIKNIQNVNDLGILLKYKET